MASINKQIIMGRLGRDPEVKELPNGQKMAKLSVATTDWWKDRKTGEWNKRTEWHRVTCWRHMAEKAERFLVKGSHVYIEGKTETKEWKDKEGIDRRGKEVNASLLLDISRSTVSKPGEGEAAPAEGQAQGQADDGDDDLPF